MDKQARFADQQKFDYPLLSDTDGTVATQFGVKRGLLGKFMPVKRTTFVIDTDRTVLDVIASEISMDSHAEHGAVGVDHDRRALDLMSRP